MGRETHTYHIVINIYIYIIVYAYIYLWLFLLSPLLVTPEEIAILGCCQVDASSLMWGGVGWGGVGHVNVRLHLRHEVDVSL